MKIRTRFAPSPTGYMHLGNIWVAFLNWYSTRQNRGEIVLRIEDIDRQRCREEYIQGILCDLEWLGIDFDEGPQGEYSYGSTIQSKRYPLYDRFFEELKRQKAVYPCFCTRARLHGISSAPHIGEDTPVYDGKCRNMSKEEIAAQTKSPSWRIKMSGGNYTFSDRFCGEQQKSLQPCRDDFVIRRADGMVAYQLAVSYDDADMGITHVMRGNDLLGSTFYQMVIFDLLKKKHPEYMHLPLLVDEKGVRLSKRQQGLTVRELRRDGISADKIIGRLLYWAGAISEPAAVSAEQALRNIPFSACTKLTEKMITVQY